MGGFGHVPRSHVSLTTVASVYEFPCSLTPFAGDAVHLPRVQQVHVHGRRGRIVPQQVANEETSLLRCTQRAGTRLRRLIQARQIGGGLHAIDFKRGVGLFKIYAMHFPHHPQAGTPVPRWKHNRESKRDMAAPESEPMQPNTDDATLHAKYTPASQQPRVVVKMSDMPDDMQRNAIELALTALQRFKLERDMARYIKKEFDTKYQPSWHCIVGRHFGSYVTHDTAGFLYFYIHKIAILLFRSG